MHGLVTSNSNVLEGHWLAVDDESRKKNVRGLYTWSLERIPKGCKGKDSLSWWYACYVNEIFIFSFFSFTVFF